MPLCANACGRKTEGKARFCMRCLTQPPLVHPALLPEAYLQACVFELAGRGAQDGKERTRRLVDDAWDRARGKLSTELARSSTSEVGR